MVRFGTLLSGLSLGLDFVFVRRSLRTPFCRQRVKRAGRLMQRLLDLSFVDSAEEVSSIIINNDRRTDKEEGKQVVFA